MIRSFRKRNAAEDIFNGYYAKGIDRSVQKRAHLKFWRSITPRGLRIYAFRRATISKFCAATGGGNIVSASITSGAFALPGATVARKMSNCSIIIEGANMARKRDIKPVHPGRLLAEEFMRPSGVTQYRLAKATG